MGGPDALLDEGRICIPNNTAERAVRGIALSRKELDLRRFGHRRARAAAIYALFETCKLNDVDPRAWLADVLARIADHPARRIAELLPWNWKAAQVHAPDLNLRCGIHRMLTGLRRIATADIRPSQDYALLMRRVRAEKIAIESPERAGRVAQVLNLRASGLQSE